MTDFTKILGEKYKDSSILAEDLLKETGIALLPGIDFGFDK